MLKMKFTKRISSNYEKILKAKKKNFLKRSLIRYVIAAALITFVKPDLLGNWGLTFLGLASVLIIFSFIVMNQSAKFMGNRLKLDANIDFDENGFQINHFDNSLDTERIEWDLSLIHI